MQNIKRSASFIFNHPLLFWILIVVVFCAARIATWGYPYDSDNWIFYYVGKTWADGGLLYVNAWDHKAPLIFLFNAVMYVIAGNNIVLQRVWLTVLAVVTTLLFYRLAKKVIPRLIVASKKSANADILAKVALVIFVFFSNLSQFASSGNNTECYGLLFLVGMWVAYYLFVERQRWWYLALSGVCFSALFFLKGTFLLFGIPIAVVLFMRYRTSLRTFFRLSAIFVVPIIVQTIVWLGYFWQKGTLSEFMVATFSFSAKYAGSAWHGRVSNEPLLVIVSLLFLIPVVVAFIAYLRNVKRMAHDEAYVIIGLSLVLGLVVVLSVGSLYPYYFEICMPFTALVVTYSLVQIRSLRHWVRNSILGVIIAICIVFYAISLKQLANNFTGASYQSAQEYTSIATYVDGHTTSSNKVFDDSYGATFYALSDRQSGTRFVSASVMLLDYRDNYGFQLDNLFISDMEKNMTTYVLVPRDAQSIYNANIPATNYIRTHYHLEKSFTTIDLLRRND